MASTDVYLQDLTRRVVELWRRRIFGGVGNVISRKSRCHFMLINIGEHVHYGFDGINCEWIENHSVLWLASNGTVLHC